MNNSPILVTGAAGFIGFHTARTLLQSGKSVVGIDNLNSYYDVKLKDDRLQQLKTFEKFSFVKVDISDKDAMEALWLKNGPFVEVVHLAAQAGVRYSLENPYEYITSNCMGHLTILEMCRHTEGFKHLVYASSSSVYGGNEKLPYSTKDPVNNPRSLYAATKRSDELMSQSYSHLYNIAQTGLRFFTVYGPWGRPDMAPHIFTKAIINDDPVPVFNHGKMKRDFTYIDDIVKGIIGVINEPPKKEDAKIPHRVLNIGNSKSENLLDFISTLEKSIGKKANINLLPMQAGDVKETYADVSDITQLTGFHAKTSIDEGIPQFIKWYKEYYKIK